mgnify:CR=1 FL=1
MPSPTTTTETYRIAVARAGRVVPLFLALLLGPPSPAFAEGASAAPASDEITVGGLRFPVAAGEWIRRSGAEGLTCVAEACRGAELTVATVDGPCDDDLLRRSLGQDVHRLRDAPAISAGPQGPTFRVATVTSPCRSLSGDTLVACTVAGGRTRLVAVDGGSAARCRLPTTTVRATRALLGRARADAP